MENLNELEKLKEYKAYIQACEKNKEEQDSLLDKLETPLFEYMKKKLSNKVFRYGQNMIYIKEVIGIETDDNVYSSNIRLDYTLFQYDELGLKITKGTCMDIYYIDSLIELSPEEANTAKEKILNFVNMTTNF